MDHILAERIKEYRKQNGFSQEQLAQEAGLNLRTVQRIENGETVPRGDSLRRLAMALNTSPDELIDWQSREDKNVLIILVLSQLTFLAFPILGILVPLSIWILKKDKVKKVDQLGKSILNFQITWVLFFFSVSILTVLAAILPGWSELIIIMVVLYGYNILLVVINTVLVIKDKGFFYKPALRILR